MESAFLFRQGEMVYVDPGSLTTLGLGDSGPFPVVDIQHVPPKKCGCGGEEYGREGHSEYCPMADPRPYGGVGHPQWVILQIGDGGASLRRFSGAWLRPCPHIAV